MQIELATEMLEKASNVQLVSALRQGNVIDLMQEQGWKKGHISTDKYGVTSVDMVFVLDGKYIHASLPFSPYINVKNILNNSLQSIAKVDQKLEKEIKKILIRESFKHSIDYFVGASGFEEHPFVKQFGLKDLDRGTLRILRGSAKSWLLGYKAVSSMLSKEGYEEWLKALPGMTEDASRCEKFISDCNEIEPE